MAAYVTDGEQSGAKSGASGELQRNGSAQAPARQPQAFGRSWLCEGVCKPVRVTRLQFCVAITMLTHAVSEPVTP